MIKSILSSSYDFQQQVAQFVGVTSRGLDTQHLRKAASSAGIFKGLDVKPENGKAVIHVIAMGSAPFYPANKNGDTFFDTDRTVTMNLTGEDIHLGKGLVDTHKTFETDAKVFKEHFNTKNDKVYGDVLKAGYNPDMHRVELLLSIPVDEWVDELGKLEKGDDFGVSMSCFPGHTLVYTESGMSEIKDIGLGDKVLSHTGEFREVTGLMSRETSEALDIVVSCASNDPITVTREHPFLVVDWSIIHPKYDKNGEDGRRVYAMQHRDRIKDCLTWVPASRLKKGDYVVTPIPQFEGSSDITPDEAKVLGYYLAEGSLAYNVNKKDGVRTPSGVIFTCHKNDILTAEIASLIPKEEYVSCKFKQRTNSADALDIVFWGTEYAKYIFGAMSSSNDKHIPKDIFTASRESKLSFITGWFNGDGWQDSRGIHFSMAQSGKARSTELQWLLASVGIPSSVTNITHKPRTIGANTKIYTVEKEYVVNVPNRYSDIFLTVRNTKIKPYRSPAFIKEQTFISNGYLVYRVKKIRESRFSGTVYNISVDKDESYTANGISVHNCRLQADLCNCCANRASSRKEYCDHLKYGLNQITSGGHLVSAINDNVTFFDISGVGAPADRIAFSLLKAASVGPVIGGAQLAEMLKVSSDLVTTKSGFVGVLRKMAEMEKIIEGQVLAGSHDALNGTAIDNLPDDKLAQLKAANLRSSELLGCLADVKVALSLEDFLKILLGPSFEEVRHLVPGAESRLPGVFSRICVDPKLGDGAVDLQDSPMPMCVKRMLSDLQDSNGLDDDSVRRRVTIVAVRGGKPLSIKSASVLPADSAEEIIAQLYGQYKAAFCHKHLADNGLTFCSVLGHYINHK